MRSTDAFAGAGAALEAERPAGLSRRQLLRAGVWAAPALVLATAAPAAAASTPTAVPVHMYTFSQNGISEVWDGNANVVTAFFGAVSFQPSGSVTVTSATLTLTLDKKGLEETKPIVVSGAGWVAATVASHGKSMVYTFVWAGSTAPYTDSPTLQYKLIADGKTRSGNAKPKTASGSLSGAQIQTATNQVTWT